MSVTAVPKYPAHRAETGQGIAEARLRPVEIALEIVDETEVFQLVRDPDRFSQVTRDPRARQ